MEALLSSGRSRAIRQAGGFFAFRKFPAKPGSSAEPLLSGLRRLAGAESSATIRPCSLFR